MYLYINVCFSTRESWNGVTCCALWVSIHLVWRPRPDCYGEGVKVCFFPWGSGFLHLSWLFLPIYSFPRSCQPAVFSFASVSAAFFSIFLFFFSSSALSLFFFPICSCMHWALTTAAIEAPTPLPSRLPSYPYFTYHKYTRVLY